MRRFLLFVLAVMAFAACTNDSVEEQVAIRHEAPETITVGFEDDDTRIQLNEAQKTVWTKDDLVSVFYRSNANQKWQYQGETGERIAELTRVDAGEATATMNRVVVVYPYNDDYYINTETYNIQAFLPAVQTYLKDSYGLNGNIMISQSEYNQFSLKSVCGWLKLQLTGDGEVVKSIKFCGNNDEQVAGELYINSADATAMLASDMGDTDDNNAGGNLVFDDTILTEVTLDCGEGVTLGAEVTTFYIALPPQTFEKGFTVVIESDGYKPKTLSTEKRLTIERNHIQPMATMEFVPPVPNNQIWYTSSDGNIVTPGKTKGFGANIVSNEYKDGLGVITFDGDVTEIVDYAFHNCDSLTSVTIPDSVTRIGARAFNDCDSLTSVTIGNGVKTISVYAFYSCDSLTSVYISDIAAWCNISFINNNSHPLYENNEGNLYLNNRLVTDLIIPDSVTTIRDYAFLHCYSLTSVDIPESVTTIGQGAFLSCDSLKNVNIPDSVTTIGKSAFSGCEILTSVTIPNSVTTIGEAAFSYCFGLTSVTIGDGVTTIGKYVFNNCDSLTSVTIPGSVTMIGEEAFSFCNSLASVTIGDGVTKIIRAAFYSCNSLTSVTIPDSVTWIGEWAFGYCTSLTSVTIPASVTKIDANAFRYCTGLTSVYCKATTPPVLGYSNVFDDNGSGRKIYVPAGSVEAYKSATYWSEYASAIVGYDF